jgi:hypothetical protein
MLSNTYSTFFLTLVQMVVLHRKHSQTPQSYLVGDSRIEITFNYEIDEFTSQYSEI